MAISVSYGPTMGPFFFPQVDRTLAPIPAGESSPVTPTTPNPPPHLPHGKSRASKGAGQGCGEQELLRESTQVFIFNLKKNRNTKTRFQKLWPILNVYIEQMNTLTHAQI